MMTRNMLAIVACAGAIGACSGENLFTGPGTADGSDPEIVAVTVPESVTRNGILRVEVDATSEEGITTLDIVLEEGLVRDTTVTFDPPDLDVDGVVEFDVPETVTPGSTIRVTVTVMDRLGATSEAVEEEVPVVEDDDGGT